MLNVERQMLNVETPTYKNYKRFCL